VAERRDNAPVLGAPAGRALTRHARRLARRLASLGDARLSALHRGDFRLRCRASVTGICAGSVTASSSRPGRSARRSAFRTSRDDGSRAAAAGRHSPLRIQDRLENTPQMSEDANLYHSSQIVVNEKILFVYTPLFEAVSDRERPAGYMATVRKRVGWAKSIPKPPPRGPTGRSRPSSTGYGAHDFAHADERSGAPLPTPPVRRFCSHVLAVGRP